MANISRSNLSLIGLLVTGVAAVVGILALGWWTRQAPPSPVPAETAVIRNQTADSAVFTEAGRTFREYGRGYDQAPAQVGVWDGYADVGGTLAYTARQGDAEFVVFRDRELGRDRSGGIIGLAGVAGQVAYAAITPTKVTAVGLGSTLFLGEKPAGQQYDFVREIATVNGKLTYVGVKFAPDGTERAVINHGGVEYGAAHASVASPFSYEEKLAFLARDGALEIVWSVVVIAEGNERAVPASQFTDGIVQDSFGRVVHVTPDGRYRDWAIVDGVLATVELSVDGARTVARYDDAPFGQGYDDVLEVENINGKIAWLVRRNGKGVIVYDGQEFGRRYDAIYDQPGEKNDAYALELAPGAFTVLKHIGSVGGKLTYVASVAVTEDGGLKTVVVKEE